MTLPDETELADLGGWRDPDIAAEKYILRLYVTGMTARAARTIETLRTFCEKHLAGRYELQVIDVYQQPELARTEQIVAVPTLIKKLPLPLRRLIGDMSDEARVLVGLDILPHSDNGSGHGSGGG